MNRSMLETTKQAFIRLLSPHEVRATGQNARSQHERYIVARYSNRPAYAVRLGNRGESARRIAVEHSECAPSVARAYADYICIKEVLAGLAQLIKNLK